MRLLVKIGGTLLERPDTRQALAAQAAELARRGDRITIVHGGGKRLSRRLEREGVVSQFLGGLRVTPPEIMEMVVEVFAGHVNHTLVAELQRAGARAVGLSGIDAGLIEAVQLSPELGAVGEVVRTDASLLDLLTENGFVPAVACIAGGADGAIFNVNADQMAAALAGGFQADRVIFLTDVAGVLDSSQRLIHKLSAAEAENLIAEGTARGGMEAKLRAALKALAAGASEVSILGGDAPDALLSLLAGSPSGTTVHL